MTQAFNLSQLANNLNSSGQLDATDGLVNAVPVANGGTGASSAAAARTNLSAAIFGANSDITSLSGLTTALSVSQGGTGATTFTSGALLKGSGTGAIAVATAANIVSAIGATAVQNATSASSATSATTATSLTTAGGSAPSYSVRAWAVITIGSNGGAITLASSGNITSVTRSGAAAGGFYVTFTTAMPDANYDVNINAGLALGNTNAPFVQLFANNVVNNYTAPTASGFYFLTGHLGNLNVQDCARICITVLR
jgi:hypothetical protein